MNIRELIPALLEHGSDPAMEVRIEVKGKSIGIYRVNIGGRGSYTVLTIEPDEGLITVDDAQDGST